MTALLTALWWGTKLGWSAAVARETYRRRFAAAYLTALVAVAGAYGWSWVPFEPAVVALVGCGVSLAPRIPDTRAALTSGSLTALPPRRRARLSLAFCDVCGAASGQRCDAGLHG